MSQENQTLKNVGLVALGAAVGAALGILFAPKSGKETREDVADWMRERREKGNVLLGRLREKLPVKKERLTAAFKAGKEAYFANGAEKESPVEG